MSDSERRQTIENPAKPKPDAPARKNRSSRTSQSAAAKSTESNPPGSKPKRLRRRKKAAPAAIQIEPDEAARHDETLAEKLKDEARTGLPGLAVSIGVHLLLLGLFALIVIGGASTIDEDPAMEFGWISAAASRASDAANRPLAIPIDVTRPNPVGTSSDDAANTKKQETPNPTNGGVAVSPAEVKNILNGRDRDKRGKMLEKYGGGEATERAVNNGLMWLKRQQRAAGNWSLHEGYPDAGYSTIRTDTGATALAVLAFLGTGHTHTYGDHQDTVARGLKWLMGVQKTDGNFHDHIEIGRQTAYYAHSQATIALCEAYAMTGDQNLRESAEAGIAFLIDSQQPTNGGWKYVPQDDKTVGDLSVTGWALMALHTARVAGFDIPPDVFDLSANFLDTVQQQNGARYKYEPSDPPDRVSVAMTAEGLLCRQFLGWPADFPALQQGLGFITQPKNRPQWSEGRRNVYEWYYVGHVLHNAGGEKWREWYQAVQEAIVPAQNRTGPSRGESDVRGSWHPTEPKGSPHEYADKAGRLYLTAMCILILEMPYRHLPIYEE